MEKVQNSKYKFHLLRMGRNVFLLFLLIAEFSKWTFSQQEFIGTITGFSSDEQVIFSGERKENLEIGDVLVVQRNGEKVGLIRVIEIENEVLKGEILSVEKDQKLEIGDMVSFQLLGAEILKQPLSLPPLELKTSQLGKIIEYKPQKDEMGIVDEEVNEKLEILEREPQNRTNLINLADVYMKKGWYELALKTYKSAIEMDTKAEDTDMLLFKVAECYLSLGKYESAIAYFKFLKKYYPNSTYFKSADEKLRLLGVVEEKVLPIQKPLIELREETKKEKRKIEFEKSDVKKIITPDDLGLKRSIPKKLMKINTEDEKKK